jgi:hypothetical protein
MDNNRRRSVKGIRLVAVIMAMLLASVSGTAFAEDQGTANELPASAVESASEASHALAQLTDAKVASELPHHDLGREEAFDLLEGVFEPVLQSPAGEFDNLDVEKFLSDTAALILPVANRSASAVTAGVEAASQHEEMPALLESTVPLRVEGTDGSSEAIDLSLEHVDGQLQSATPVVPVAIPQELDEGIELPDAGVQIELVGAPERSPSIIEESVAAYPNVDTDTDLAVAPMPTGVETLTTLRTPDAPRTQTFHLDLPEGASLIEADHGAEVVRAGETILDVQPASAIDAAGTSVPVSMTVSGDELIVQVSPQVGTAYPILVDPLYEGFSWRNGATQGWSGWTPWTNTATIIPGFGENWGPGYMGAYIEAQAKSYAGGAQAMWTHGVPRLAEEEAKGHYPTSYITNFSLQGIYLITSPGLASPFLFGGIFDPATQKWAGNPGNETVWSWPGNAPSWLQNATINFENGVAGSRDKHAQRAYGTSLAVSEPGYLASPRASYLGAASVQIADEDNPTVANASAPTVWVNQTPAGPITVEAADTGLGIKNVTFAVPGQGEKTVGNACGGQTQDPCPSHQTVSLSSSQYSVSGLPTGYTYVPIRALDVLWNATPENALARAQIKVDHVKPGLSLSGTLTEQGTLGATLPSYALKYVATDGTEVAPQSGVASTEVKIDGKAVEAKYAPGCTTKNCAISREWTLTASQYSTGQHTIEVIATDAVGLSTTQSLTITISKDQTAPTLSTSGPFFSGPEGWLMQNTYTAQVTATDPGGYGMKSLLFKFDGATIQSTNLNCIKGGCEASLSAALNMASYGGGAHAAEVVATDGMGNTTTRKWTINVDPRGEIPTQQVVDTLEAAEVTSQGQPIASPVDVGDPAELEEKNKQLHTIDTNVDTSIGTESSVSMKMEAASHAVLEGAETGDISESQPNSISITPTKEASEAMGPLMVNGASAVTANTASQVDTVVRPIYDGATAFENIRDVTGPEEFSWQVSLYPEQTLTKIDSQNAAVIYSDGTVAMSISAEAAHDATGAYVATTLSVVGNVVTLKVSHRLLGVVYPVLAGPTFEVGYSTVEVIIPPPPSHPPEARPLAEPPYLITGNTSAPEAVSLQDAGLSEFDASAQALMSVSPGPHRRHYAQVQCPAGAFVESDIGCGNPWQGQHPDYSWVEGMRTTYMINPGSDVVWHRGDYESNIGCVQATQGPSMNPIQTTCRWINKKAEGHDNYIAAHGNWNIQWEDVKYDAGYTPMTEHIYGSGYRYTSQTSCPGDC